MVPRLHPRSGFTTSLFSTTLAVCFLVVGLPHVLPCPVDTRQHTDGMSPQQQMRRKRRRVEAGAENPLSVVEAKMENHQAAPNDSGSVEGVEPVPTTRRGRECPVPKPRGTIGRMLGFTEENTEARAPKPEVLIEKAARRDRRDAEDASREPAQTHRDGTGR